MPKVNKPLPGVRNLNTPDDVVKFLNKVINEVRKRQISETSAKTLGYLSSLMLKAIETSQLEKRLESLENLLQERI